MSLQGRYNSVVQGNIEIENCIREIIEEHKASFDPENVRDFIDLYLKTDPSNGKHIFKRAAYTLRKKVLQSTFFGASGCHK